ncbi:MAG: hypothetical protein H6707_13165 [Deltaproteobacteria bacterium]|nr:hypothetical protein [Deltaproteobacteria bacterium]
MRAALLLLGTSLIGLSMPAEARDTRHTLKQLEQEIIELHFFKDPGNGLLKPRLERWQTAGTPTQRASKTAWLESAQADPRFGKNPRSPYRRAYQNVMQQLHSQAWRPRQLRLNRH